MNGSEAAQFDPRRVIRGPKDGKPRLLHTNLRVRDMDAALRFYVDGLGMTVMERVEVESRGATVAFVGFNADEAGRLLELSCYRDRDEAYAHGTGYGHVAVGVLGIAAMLEKLETMGVEVAEPPVTLAPGAPARAIVRDPDGYAVELIETARRST